MCISFWILMKNNFILPPLFPLPVHPPALTKLWKFRKRSACWANTHHFHSKWMGKKISSRYLADRRRAAILPKNQFEAMVFVAMCDATYSDGHFRFTFTKCLLQLLFISLTTVAKIKYRNIVVVVVVVVAVVWMCSPASAVHRRSTAQHGMGR